MFTPATEVYLLNTPLKSNNKNQISFSSRQEQHNYFSSLAVRRFTDFTYQRQDSIIRVPINAEVILNEGINYVMYDNANFSNRWIYAFVTKVEYVNANVTHLHIKTDVFQTWLLECEIKPSFIVRETVKDDTLFKHTIPENLSTGDLKIAMQKDITQNKLTAKSQAEFNENYYCLVMCSEAVTAIGDYTIGLDMFSGGSVNGCFMYACTLDSFETMIREINEAGKAKAIVSCIAIPKMFVDFYPLDTPTPPTPPTPTGSNYLGSPFSSNFTISQTFNPPGHYGIDMYGATDLNIYSTTAGTVVFAGWNTGGYGNLVVVESPQHYFYIFGHLSSIAVSENQQVNAGDNIGIQGNTGDSQGSHLHYEITTSYGTADWNAGAVNPASAEFGAEYQNQEGYY